MAPAASRNDVLVTEVSRSARGRSWHRGGMTGAGPRDRCRWTRRERGCGPGRPCGGEAHASGPDGRDASMMCPVTGSPRTGVDPGAPEPTSTPNGFLQGVPREGAANTVEQFRKARRKLQAVRQKQERSSVDSRERTPGPCVVVALGTSAGGLEAFKSFFQN